MAFSESLAGRIRDTLTGKKGVEEKKMFGGVGFLLNGNMLVCVWKDLLVVRLTCHHRTQVQSWLRLAGYEPVPAIYGPSGDVKWDEANPTYSLEAARRGG